MTPDDAQDERRALRPSSSSAHGSLDEGFRLQVEESSEYKLRQRTRTLSSSSLHSSSSNNFRLLLYCCAIFTNGFYVNLRGSVIHDLAAHCNVSPDRMGDFFLASGVGGMLAALPTGLLVDRLRNPHLLLGMGLVLRALACTALTVTKSFEGMCFVGACIGATLPIVGVALRTAIVWHRGTRAGASLNVLMASFGLGSILAPFGHNGLAALWGSGSVYILPGLTLTSFEALWVIYAVVLLCLALSATVLPPAPQPPASMSLSAQYDLAVLVPLTLFLGTSVAAENTIGGWIYTMAHQGKAALSKTEASALNSTVWLTFTATRFAVAALSSETLKARLGRCITPYRLLFFGCCLGLLPQAVFLNTPKGYAEQSLWFFAVTFGIAASIWYPNGMALGTQLIRGGRYGGAVVAVFELVGAAGDGIGPGIAYFLAKYIQWNPDVAANDGDAAIILTSSGCIFLMLFLLLMPLRP